MPTGNRIDDGFATTISFSSNPNVKLWEKQVTPPGVQGGGANDTTTMRNTAWRTRSPKKLKTLSDSSFTAAYDPAVYSQIVAMLNTNQQITVTFPSGKTLVFWGWLDEFTPNRVVEGAQPEAECKIIPSNQNTSGVETAPTYPS
jgi:hypothetical protein